MKVCLIPLILYKLAISDPPSLKFFMSLNQFSHKYALKHLHQSGHTGYTALCFLPWFF